MPELLTKYPEIVIKILSDANAKCGKGAPQTILTTCPKDQFCALPTGELCIYGTKDASQMTQLHPVNVLMTANAIIPFIALSIMIFIVGLWVGTKINKSSI